MEASSKKHKSVSLDKFKQKIKMKEMITVPKVEQLLPNDLEVSNKDKKVNWLLISRKYSVRVSSGYRTWQRIIVFGSVASIFISKTPTTSVESPQSWPVAGKLDLQTTNRTWALE